MTTLDVRRTTSGEGQQLATRPCSKRLSVTAPNFATHRKASEDQCRNEQAMRR